jgi:hypothetical protein
MLRHSHLEVQIVEGRSPGLANMTHSSPRPPTCLELFGGFRELKEDDNKLVIWKSRFLRVVVLDFRNITHAPPRPIWKSRFSMVFPGLPKHHPRPTPPTSLFRALWWIPWTQRRRWQSSHLEVQISEGRFSGLTKHHQRPTPRTNLFWNRTFFISTPGLVPLDLQ